MLLLGLGLGLVMQVLVLAAQNAVDYRLLGVAPSGSTLFRQVGGSIGPSWLLRDVPLRETAGAAGRPPRIDASGSGRGSVARAGWRSHASY